MKAITRTKYGSPSVLKIQEIEKPTLSKRAVMLRVHATTINRTDCGILHGKPYLIRLFTGLFSPSHLVPGTDFAGEVVAIGEGVQDFKIGDRVWGLHDEGLQSQATFMCINEKKAIAKIPAHVSYHQAVASAEGAHYAFNIINTVKLKSGDKAMVNGATGAIGSATVQLLKNRGIYVTAVGNTKNLERVKALGADKVIDYEKEDFTQDNEKYQFVFDTVGKSTFSKCKRIMTPGGIYISSELGPNWQNVYLPLLTAFGAKHKVIFPIPVNCRKTILFMTDLLQKKKFNPLIDRKYKMNEVQEAYAYVHSGQKTGNVLLLIE